MKIVEYALGWSVILLCFSLLAIGAIRIVQAIRRQDRSLLAHTFESWVLKIQLLALVVAGVIAALSSGAELKCPGSFLGSPGSGAARPELSFSQLILVALWLTIALGAASLHSLLLRRIIGVDFQNAEPKHQLLLHVSRVLLLTPLTIVSVVLGWTMRAPRCPWLF
jgi:hypothetical protein